MSIDNEQLIFKIPEDGNNVIEIAELEFDFVDDECHWDIRGNFNGLYTQIVVKTSQIKQANDAGLLMTTDTIEPGCIKFRLYSKDVYKNGIPTCEHTLIRPSLSGRNLQCAVDVNGDPTAGISFAGKLTMKESWLGLNGVLKHYSSDQLVWPITVYKKLRTKNINWGDYEFTLKEAQEVSPELVAGVSMIDYAEAAFPEAVLEYTNLQIITISATNRNRLLLCDVPEGIGKLDKLFDIRIANTNIEQLPKGLFQLPNLKSLFLDDNKLRSLPETIKLPQLRSISLRKNRLENLPAALAEQPQLSNIYLEDNVWKSLPDSFSATKAELHLNLIDKKRLLDYTYRGADNKGASKHNNELFLAKNDSQLNSMMNHAIKNTVLESHHEEITQSAFKAVCINTTFADDYTGLGNTRFGGMPDLPVGHAYPFLTTEYATRPIDHNIFIAQINCEEVASYQDYLPRQGILYFFVEEADSYTSSVLYHPNDKNLTSATKLSDMDFRSTYLLEPYKPFKAEFSPMVALPARVDGQSLYDHEELAEPHMTNIFSETFCRNLGRTGLHNEKRDYFYTNLEHSINDTTPGLGESPPEMAANEKKGKPEDWIILLRVRSDPKCNFMFYDAGDLYFLIHKSDLAKADFSNVFAFAESS